MDKVVGNLILMLIAANLPEPGHAQVSAVSVLSQPLPGKCQFTSSQSETTFLPNLPDTNFRLRRVARRRTRSTLTTLYGSEGTTFIFTVPSIPALGNCSTAGDVVAIHYCYQTWDKFLEKTYQAFHLLSMTRDKLQFTVTNRLTISTTPTKNICRNVQHSSLQVCCDRITLNVDQQFQIPLREYTFGMVIASRDIDLLAFVDSPLKQPLEQFRTRVADRTGPQFGDTFTLEENSGWTEHSILLARFYIEPSAPLPTPEVTSQSTTPTVGRTSTSELQAPPETNTGTTSQTEITATQQASTTATSNRPTTYESRAEYSPSTQLSMETPAGSSSDPTASSSGQSSLEPSGQSQSENAANSSQTVRLVASIGAGCGVLLAITLVILLIAAAVQLRLRRQKGQLWHMRMKTNDAYGLFASESVSTLPRPARTMEDDYGYIDPTEVNQPHPPLEDADKLCGMLYVVNVAYSHHLFRAEGSSLTNTEEDNVYDYIQPVRVTK